MSCKCNWLTAFAVLLALSYCSAEDLTPEKLNKSFTTINKYLEKNVNSDDPKINLAAAAELQDAKSSKCLLFGGKSLVAVIDLLKQFAAMSSKWYLCNTYQKNEMMRLVDSGLANESRSKTPNYPLTRLDRIIQHYAFADARRCGYTNGFPELKHSYKQIAYDNINGLLEKVLPEVDAVDANMAKAEELVSGMPDGALADAFRQLFQLKTLLSEDTCGELGYEILLKNDLATRREAVDGYETPKRRVGKIVQHYAKQHEQLCRPIVPGLVKSAIKTLDRDTYRLVLGLVSGYFVESSKFGELMKQLNQKDVDENFSTPVLIELATKQMDKFHGKANYQLDLNSWIAPETLFYYVIAASGKDPLGKYIHGAIGSNHGSMNPYYSRRKVFEEDKLKKLLARYLFNPCGRFLEVVGGLVEADNYGVNMNMRHVGSCREEFLKEISYHTARAGYFGCKYLVDSQDNVIQAIMDTSDNHEIPESFNLSTLFGSEK